MSSAEFDHLQYQQKQLNFYLSLAHASIFLVASLVVIYTLKNHLDRYNVGSILIFNAAFISRAILTFIFFESKNQEDDNVVMFEETIYEAWKHYLDFIQIDTFLLIIFYLIILRMINFWDFIFFQKIAEIHHADIFEG